MFPFHKEPICVTISLAVCQAFSFAIAGSKSEPERKNNRVNEIKINVMNIAHDRSSHENPKLYLPRLYKYLIIAPNKINSINANNIFHNGVGYNNAIIKTHGRGTGLSDMFGSKFSTIDLHVHSSVSDGKKDFTQIGNAATENKLDVLAIVDHDTIKGQIELFEGKRNLGNYRGKFVNGVEITSMLGDRRIEVLVYDYDVFKAKKLIDDFKFPFLNRKFKIKRNAQCLQERLDVINENGYHSKKLTLNDFIGLEINGEEKPKMFSELGLDVKKDLDFEQDDFKQQVTIDGKEYNVNFDDFNSKLYNYLCQDEKGKEFLASLKTPEGKAIEKFADFNRGVIQAKGSVLEVDDSGYWPTVEQVCTFAKESGGVAILAHPFGYNKAQGQPGDIVKDAVAAGVDGIEVWHGFNKAKQVEKLYNYCKRNNLLITMGSDSHGYEKTSKGVAYPIGSAPGYEGEEPDKDELVHETKLTIENLRSIAGEYNKKLESAGSQFGG